VCSAATAWRIVAQELPDDPRGIAALWSALARVREQAWALGAAPAGPLILDVDATLVDAHSDKQGAAPTYKQGFGFPPLGCWLDRGDGTGEALAGMLRPGNAGANTAADHLDVLAMALLGLPKHARRQPILVRADPAGATHAFVADIVRRKLWFSIGLDLTEPVRQAILALPEQAWQPALDQDGAPPPPQRRGRGACKPGACPLRLARGHPGDLPPRAAPPRRGTQDGLHRPARPPLPGVHHQPDRPGPCRAGGPPPSPRSRGRPHPHRQGQRPAQPPLLGLCRQRCLAHPGHDRPDPGLLGAGAAVGRRPRRRRAQDAALPAVAYRRPDRPSRPPPHHPHRSRLALGRPPGPRFWRARGPAGALLNQPTSPDIAAPTRHMPAMPACRSNHHASMPTHPCLVQAADRLARIA